MSAACGRRGRRPAQPASASTAWAQVGAGQEGGLDVLVARCLLMGAADRSCRPVMHALAVPQQHWHVMAAGRTPANPALALAPALLTPPLQPGAAAQAAAASGASVLSCRS